MSWSLCGIGSPEAVARKVEQDAKGYQPPEGSTNPPSQSAIEIGEAAPHVAALVRQAFENREDEPQPIVKLNAYGSGLSEGGNQTQRSITVTLETLWPSVS